MCRKYPFIFPARFASEKSSNHKKLRDKFISKRGKKTPLSQSKEKVDNKILKVMKNTPLSM